MTQRSYPEGRPGLPQWLGINEIVGPHGDLLYGSYNRSYNMFVSTGTEVEQRKGFVRALDQRFWGGADGEFIREGGIRYQTVVDGVGLHVFNSVVSKPNLGVRTTHPGFPVDNFDRANNASVSDGTDPQRLWGEGDISGSGAAELGTDWKIDTNDCTLEATGAAWSRGTVDHSFLAPTMFSTELLDLDWVTLAPTTDSLQTHVELYHGMHGQLVTANTVYGRAGSANDAWVYNTTPNDYAPRTGFVLEMKVREETSGTDRYELVMTLRPFLSEFKTGETPAAGTIIKGGRSKISTQGTYLFEDLATLQQNHALELGAIQNADLGSWKLRCRFWVNNTVDGLKDNPGTDPDVDLELDIVKDSPAEWRSGSGRGFNILPWGNNPGVRFSFGGEVRDDGATDNEFRIAAVTAGLSYLP